LRLPKMQKKKKGGKGKFLGLGSDGEEKTTQTYHQGSKRKV